MARLTNKALTKQNGARQNGPAKTSESHFDSSECRFTNRKERKASANRVRVSPSNPADTPKIEFPAYTGRALPRLSSRLILAVLVAISSI